MQPPINVHTPHSSAQLALLPPKHLNQLESHGMESRLFNTPAKKALGQHFLVDRYYIDRIIHVINPQPNDHIVEIGPGQGAITLPLLKCCGSLTAIELDRDLIAPLTAAATPIGKLDIIHRDVLTVDLSILAKQGNKKLRLVGNLPYNISSPILFHVLQQAAIIADMHFMLQKEVVDRMAAPPGSKVYGRLSVMLQAWCEVTTMFVVPPDAFQPPPKVNSAITRLVPRDPTTIRIADTKRFSDIVRAAFGQRRKTLRNSLADICTPAHFEHAGIRTNARAEQLEVTEFIALANAKNT